MTVVPALPHLRVGLGAPLRQVAKQSTLPFLAPDFASIKDKDYLPAMLAGMAQQKAEVLAIANQKANPTFDNVLVALERSGLLLDGPECVATPHPAQCNGERHNALSHHSRSKNGVASLA